MATSPVLFVYYPPSNDDSWPGVPGRHITEADWASFTIAQRRTIENATTQEGYTRRKVWVHIDLVDETEEERAQREAEEAAARAEYDRKNSLVRYGQIEAMIDQLEVLPPAEEFAALRQDVDAVADVPPRVEAVETQVGAVETKVARVDPGAAPTASQSLRGSVTGPYYAPSSIVYPEDFGGRGNNSIDNATALQQAIDAAAATAQAGDTGATVGLLYGTYLISAPVIVPRNGNTPTQVVNITGHSMRTSTLRGTPSFPANRALIENARTLARNWHHRYSNLRLAVPDVAGCMAIWYPKHGTGTTGTNYSQEWSQIDFEDLLIETNSTFHQRAIYLEVGTRYGNLRNVYLDPGPGTNQQYDTVLLEVGDSLAGADPGITDFVGVCMTNLDSVHANIRRGGNATLFKGRSFNSNWRNIVSQGARKDPQFAFRNSHQSTFQNLRTEGYGEQPQFLLENCRFLTFEDCSPGTPDPPYNAWAANKAYVVDDLVVDSRLKSGSSGALTRRVMRCIVAGTSGSTQPAWADSGTFTDGTVTWEATTTDAAGNGIELRNSRAIRWRGRSVAEGPPAFSRRLVKVISIDAASRDNVFSDVYVNEVFSNSAANEVEILAPPSSRNLIYGFGVQGSSGSASYNPFVVGWHPDYPHIHRPVVYITASHTANIAERIISASASSGALTVTLPDPNGIAKKEYVIRKSDGSANAVTVATAAGTINGAATVDLATQNATITVESSGTGWFITARQS